MTADTSWYGQQTLVHPDYSHQPYAPYQAYEIQGDPYAGQYQYDYAQQHAYVQQHAYAEQHGYAGYGEQYGTGYGASAGQQTTGYGWPDHYPIQHEPTLAAEFTGYPGHTAYSAQAAGQGYDAQHGYAGYPDYGVYDVSGAAAISRPWEELSLIDPLPADDGSGETSTAGPEGEGTEAACFGSDGRAPESTEGGRRARAAGSGEGRGGPARGSRRRAARRRSAVITIAVPSVAVLGVAGAAAATMGPLRAHHQNTTAASSTAASQARAQALAASETRDAAERAARDQARTALQLREAAARKAAAEAPRYTLPIAYHTGLSALFGQAGTHWMQLHTGIDFPVPEGTPVHAVTGGTVTTEWNPFYGYMVKLTAPDGTVTWYCHLSSYRVRSGHVKVGDIIAYSGDTGNSTGPHLHFEVHPDGGPAVDPLPWLLARGLDPR